MGREEAGRRGCSLQAQHSLLYLTGKVRRSNVVRQYIAPLRGQGTNPDLRCYTKSSADVRYYFIRFEGNTTSPPPPYPFSKKQAHRPTGVTDRKSEYVRKGRTEVVMSYRDALQLKKHTKK